MGKILGPIPVFFAVIAEQVNGNEVHRASDVVLPQLGNELIPAYGEPIQVQTDHVQMPGMLNRISLSGKLQFF